MITAATEQDGEPLIALAADAGNFKPAEVACVAELWSAYMAHGESSGYSFLVYRHAEHLAAFACFGPHPLTEGTYDLYWICTALDMRSRGLGGQLLARVEAEVSGRGGRLLLAETSTTPAFSAARRFYETYGYRCESVIQDFYAPGDHLVLYTKHLAPQPSLPRPLTSATLTPEAGLAAQT